MAYNLIVAYDLISPGKNYDRVREAIQSLGPYYQFQFSLFYVQSAVDPVMAHRLVRATMDANDRLLVVEATGGMATFCAPEDIAAVNSVWLSSVVSVQRAA